MAIQVIAAIARAALKKAAKIASKKAAKGGARKVGSLSSKARKLGDESTIARKRYYRASERYLKKAEQSSGATSARYRQLAKESFEDALSTYDPANRQRYSKPIQRLAAEFGYDLESERQLPTDEDEMVNELARRYKKQELVVYKSSSDVLEKTLSDGEKRRQLEARSIFNSEIGSRIIGGYSDIWRDEATYFDVETGKNKVDQKKIFKALYKYFNVDNMADLLQAVENDTGEILYKMGNADEMYETVKLMINKNVLSNEAVA